MYAYRSDPRVAAFQIWEPESEDEVREVIQNLQAAEFDTPDTWYQLAITLKEGGALIGDLGLHFPPGEPGQVEVGISLAPGHQGQGHATEALQAVIEYLFAALGKHRVYARVDPDNTASLALMERVGMREEGHLRESVWIKGEWVDDVIYAILAR
jgi:RimJ/RimL family protein N-acetyltransferase